MTSADHAHPTAHRSCARALPALALALSLALLGAGGTTSAALAASRRANTSHPRAPADARARSTGLPEVTLTSSLAGPAANVTMLPAGLSLEYPVMANDLGSGPCPPPALVSALQQLGSPPISLAGATQDMTVPNGAFSGTPSSWETATLYTLPASFWSQLHCLLSTTKDPLTAGVNLRTGELPWARQIVAGAESAATNGVDFSLGNEPDRYKLPNYSSLDKPQPGEEALAVNQYLQLATNMQQALAGAPVIGPELSRPQTWEHQLPRAIETLHDHIVGVHLYPLSVCKDPAEVTIRGLLGQGAANAPAKLAFVVADAAAAHVPAIISEANSASCAGLAGVTNTPAAAVWAVRFVLSALKTGFKEVRFHFSGGPYDAFLVRGGEVLKRPLDSALVALNKWLPIGSSLQSVGGLHGSGLVGTRIAQPAGTTGGPLLILDNESSQAQQVVLRSAHGVHVEVMSAAQAGLRVAQLGSSQGRVRVTVAGNGVVAVTASP